MTGKPIPYQTVTGILSEPSPFRRRTKGTTISPHLYRPKTRDPTKAQMDSPRYLTVSAFLLMNLHLRPFNLGLLLLPDRLLTRRRQYHRTNPDLLTKQQQL